MSNKKRNLQTFSEVMKECKNEPNFVVSPGCKTENTGFFTCLRVDRESVPEGWYVYDIRHGDGGGFCTVEEHAWANHAGTFITTKKIKMNKDGFHSLQGRGGYSFL